MKSHSEAQRCSAGSESAITDEMVNAGAEVLWTDRDARMGGPWKGRGADEVCVIQTKATMRAALAAALSCGAESNRHSGAVGDEKRAEQSNPGGGHVTEPQLSELHEQKAAGMIPRPAASSSKSLTDSGMRRLWRAAGGEFYGPRVETGSMPEAKLLPFLRSLAAPAHAEAIPAKEDLDDKVHDLALFLGNESRIYCGLEPYADIEGPGWDSCRRLARALIDAGRIAL